MKAKKIAAEERPIVQTGEAGTSPVCKAESLWCQDSAQQSGNPSYGVSRISERTDAK
jgi:hypothetical protein